MHKRLWEKCLLIVIRLQQIQQATIITTQRVVMVVLVQIMGILEKSEIEQMVVML